MPDTARNPPDWTPSEWADVLATFRKAIKDDAPMSAAEFKTAVDKVLAVMFEGTVTGPSSKTLGRMAQRRWLRPVERAVGPSGRGRPTEHYRRRDVVPAVVFQFLKSGGTPDQEARDFMDAYVELDDDAYVPDLLVDLAIALNTGTPETHEVDLIEFYSRHIDQLGETPAANVLRAGSCALADLLWKLVARDLMAHGLDESRARDDARRDDVHKLGSIEKRLADVPKSIKAEENLRHEIRTELVAWLRMPDEAGEAPRS